MCNRDNKQTKQWTNGVWHYRLLYITIIVIVQVAQLLLLTSKPSVYTDTGPEQTVSLQPQMY